MDGGGLTEDEFEWRLLFDYFKQLFAQVTNPPVDPLREGLVMSLMMFTGKKLNALEDTPQHCRQLKLPHPILTNEDIDRLRKVNRADFKVATIGALFEADTTDAGGSLERTLEGLVDSAQQAIADGASLIIVTDRDVSEKMAPIPSLLATSALHHGLLDRGQRCQAGLIIESGDPREVMHFCLLSGFGANGVNPYLAFETLNDLHREGYLPEAMDPTRITDNYIAAIKKGILRTISKMGISNDGEKYAAYSEAVSDQSQKVCTLRGLFEFVEGEPVDISEVTPAEEIVKRFCTGAGQPRNLNIVGRGYENIHFAMDFLAQQNRINRGEQIERTELISAKDKAVDKWLRRKV